MAGNWNISKSKVTGFVYVRKYESTGSFYTFVRLESATFHKSIPELFHLYKNILKGSSNIETKIELDKKTITVENTDESIKIISIQPISYDSKI